MHASTPVVLRLVKFRPTQELEMTERPFDAAKKIVPFAPSRDGSSTDGEAVDKSGHAIITLLQEAANVAKDNCDRAMDVAHKLSIQLRAAEDRVKELENEVRHYQDRADRSEKWLARIYKEIEEKFFDPKVPGRTEPARR
jgi:hypothetical protein